MRICPNCGFHDSPVWRPRANRPFCEYSRIDNVEYSFPGLVEKIKEASPHPYFDGHFVYHISRTGKNVERIELELFKQMKWGQEPTEKRGNEPTIFWPWPKTEPDQKQSIITVFNEGREEAVK